MGGKQCLHPPPPPPPILLSTPLQPTPPVTADPATSAVCLCVVIHADTAHSVASMASYASWSALGGGNGGGNLGDHRGGHLSDLRDPTGILRWDGSSRLPAALAHALGRSESERSDQSKGSDMTSPLVHTPHRWGVGRVLALLSYLAPSHHASCIWRRASRPRLILVPHLSPLLILGTLPVLAVAPTAWVTAAPMRRPRSPRTFHRAAATPAASAAVERV